MAERQTRQEAPRTCGAPPQTENELTPTGVVIERLIRSGMSRDAAVSHLQRQVERGEWSLDDRFNVVIPPVKRQEREGGIQ